MLKNNDVLTWKAEARVLTAKDWVTLRLRVT